jgi:hypothetical protein
MEHIRQKLDLTSRSTSAYTVVNTDGWTSPLSEHPSMLEHPEIFEISNDEIPENFQILNYQSSSI